MTTDEFLRIWAAWKRGKLKEDDVVGLGDQERFRCAARALVLGDDGEPELVAYLQGKRDEMLARVAAHTPLVDGHHVLYRGIRWAEALLESLDAGPAIASHRGESLCYSYSREVAAGFARRKKFAEARRPGLVYPVCVSPQSIVYADHENYADVPGEVGKTLAQFAVEKEVVVVHREDVVIGAGTFERIE